MNNAEIGRMLLTAAAAFLMAAAIPLMFSDASEANPLTQEEEYYYNQLSYTDQGLYRQVYGAALSFDGGFIATGLDKDYLEENALNVVFAVRCDHPELYYLEGSIEYSSSGDLKLSFSETKENYTKEIAEIESAAEEMLSGIPENRYLAMQWLNSKLVLNTTYEDDDDVRAHNISGVFIDKSAVCEGYGLALCFLCDMLDIPCIAVIGEAGGGTDYGDHMWNYVMMGEQWFAVDVTWNDPDMGPAVSTEFLLVGSETVNGGLKFSESHIPGDVSAYVELPEIEKTAYTSTTGEDTPPVYGTVVNRYYDTLTAKQKAAYDMLLEKVLAFDEEYIKSGLTEKSDQEAVFYALYYGRPDLFYIDAMGYVPGTDEFGAGYSITRDEYMGMCAEILQGMSPLETELAGCDTVYSRTLTIHDFICENVDYKFTDEDQNIYGALAQGKAVCAGMSQALCYLLGLYGIESMAVVGTGENEAHQWAIVQMNDGKWYDTDVTWDNDYGGEAGYNYFLVGSEKFDVNHRLERYTDEGYVPSYSAGRLPEISASAYPIRPGEVNYAEIPCTVTEDGDNAVATVTLENLDYVYDLAQGVGYCVVVIGDHGKIALVSSDVPTLIKYMEDNSLTEISFVKNTAAKQISVGPITAENDVHTFAIMAGSERIALSDISKGLSAQLFIPYTPMAVDVLDFLICAWYADHPIDPVDGSNYSGGYVYLTTADLEQAYIVGSTPLKDVPASVFVIGGILLILVVIGLIKHRRTKRNLRYLMGD